MNELNLEIRQGDGGSLQEISIKGKSFMFQAWCEPRNFSQCAQIWFFKEVEMFKFRLNLKYVDGRPVIEWWTAGEILLSALNKHLDLKLKYPDIDKIIKVLNILM